MINVQGKLDGIEEPLKLSSLSSRNLHFAGDRQSGFIELHANKYLCVSKISC